MVTVAWGLFYLRVHYLKHNLGQDVMFSLPEIWII